MAESGLISRVLILLFTDLAGSTSLKAEMGDRAAGDLIALHRKHVEQIAKERNGKIEDWAGDGCFLTFETPSTAVLFALQLQHIHRNSPQLPDVYIGIHMGEISQREGKHGPSKPEGLAVDLASRIESLAIPGQILMSDAVFNSARQQISASEFGTPIAWRNYGTYALKGVGNPLQIGEAGFEGFSPLKAPSASKIDIAESISETMRDALAPEDDDSKNALKYILRFSPDDFGKAANALKMAIRSNRHNAWAHGALSYAYWEGSYQGWLQKLGVSYFDARLSARENLVSALNAGSAFAHIVESEIQLYRRQYDAAIADAKRAVDLDNDSQLATANLARILALADRCEEAIDICEKGLADDPAKPGHLYYRLALAYFSVSKFEKALELLENALTHDAKICHYAALLAAVCTCLSKNDRARAALDHYRKNSIIPPNLRDVMYFWPFKNIEVSDRFAEGLRKAKLPGQQSGYYKISEMQKLAGNEIRDLLFGKTASGFYPWSGQQEWIDRDWSGKATIRSGKKANTTVDNGKSTIEGNVIIDSWQSRWKGTKIGSPVYQNPAGSTDTKDQYILFTDFGFWPIAIEERHV